MSAQVPTLHLVCGTIAAGQSTPTARLGQSPGTIVVAEDPWLARLDPGAQTSLAASARDAARLRDAMAPHRVALLRLGLSVVPDFPANTVAGRAWMRILFEAAGVAHRRPVPDVPDAVREARLRLRNAEGAHPFTVTDAEFGLFGRHFVPPAPEKGFTRVVHRA